MFPWQQAEEWENGVDLSTATSKYKSMTEKTHNTLVIYSKIVAILQSQNCFQISSMLSFLDRSWFMWSVLMLLKKIMFLLMHHLITHLTGWQNLGIIRMILLLFWTWYFDPHYVVIVQSFKRDNYWKFCCILYIVCFMFNEK